VTPNLRDDPALTFFALRASAGREDVRVFCLKDFGEPYGAPVKERLAHLAPHLSAGAEIAEVRSHRKLILVLTDGEPSDIDVVDPRDLVENARRAVLALRARHRRFRRHSRPVRLRLARRRVRPKPPHAGAPPGRSAGPPRGTLFPLGAAITAGVISPNRKRRSG
jgi:hypothetical protein